MSENALEPASTWLQESHCGYSRTPCQTEVTINAICTTLELTRKTKAEEMEKSIMSNRRFGLIKSGSHHMHDGWLNLKCYLLGSISYDTNTTCIILSKHELQERKKILRFSAIIMITGALSLRTANKAIQRQSIVYVSDICCPCQAESSQTAPDMPVARSNSDLRLHTHTHTHSLSSASAFDSQK